MNSTDLNFMSIHELSTLIRTREVSPVQVTEAYLRRTEQINGRLNAFITISGEQALASAKDSERVITAGGWLGPLHGIPVGIKDMYATAGLRTTGGSKILEKDIPLFDATAVARLKANGAIILGKTSMHEFAYGATNENPHYGPTRNPWNLKRISGGSSGGSGVALASGMVAGALGTDGGGSIRIPSAACGVVGLKPTYGRVSRHGAITLSWSLDHMGPMARSTEDVAIMLLILAGHDPLDETSAKVPVDDYMSVIGREIRGMRLGVGIYDSFQKVDPEVTRAFDEALKVLEGLGTSIEEVSIRYLQEGYIAWYVITLAEATAWHERFLKTQASDYGSDVLIQLEAGNFITAPQYLKAQQFRTIFNREIAILMAEIDAILLPTLPIPAPPIGQKTVKIGGREITTQEAMLYLNWVANFTGRPAITVPCGFSSDGLPLGLATIGHPFAEANLLQIASAYQASTHWHTSRPDL